MKRILVDGGYVEGGVYYFFLTDHLGNNRVVANAGGTVVQKSHYYPFGMAFAESTDLEKQPYNYNGKELEQEHQLNMYDYHARQMEPTTGRFMSVDPLEEKYYSISPYAYVMNNPLKYIDPTGMWSQTSTGWTTSDVSEIEVALNNMKSNSEKSQANNDPSEGDPPFDNNTNYVGHYHYNKSMSEYTKSFEVIKNESKIRKPDAKGHVITLSTEAIFSVAGDVIMAVRFINGPDAGKTIYYAAGAVGLGGLDVAVSTSHIKFYYNGDINNFTRGSLVGKATVSSGSFFMLNLSTSIGETDAYGGHVETKSIGWGISPVPVTGSIRESNTKLFRQYRTK
ncbi:RHS repeat domain-containing protein [Dysgonomonas sp. ZJ709]|uniref:RHS repeat domain-containing protein n=1 Tax=Dysgonomonas sp. ZJ709 TaxID=2709797 RepID=UPI0021063406|nr:RHS repeat-associated core domain-containing protein [Dysgonomonas sp. ZJ709]